MVATCSEAWVPIRSSPRHGCGFDPSYICTVPVFVVCSLGWGVELSIAVLLSQIPVSPMRAPCIACLSSMVLWALYVVSSPPYIVPMRGGLCCQALAAPPSPSRILLICSPMLPHLSHAVFPNCLACCYG